MKDPDPEEREEGSESVPPGSVSSTLGWADGHEGTSAGLGVGLPPVPPPDHLQVPLVVEAHIRPVLGVGGATGLGHLGERPVADVHRVLVRGVLHGRRPVAPPERPGLAVAPAIFVGPLGHRPVHPRRRRVQGRRTLLPVHVLPDRGSVARPPARPRSRPGSLSPAEPGRRRLNRALPKGSTPLPPPPRRAAPPALGAAGEGDGGGTRETRPRRTCAPPHAAAGPGPLYCSASMECPEEGLVSARRDPDPRRRHLPDPRRTGPRAPARVLAC